MPEICITKAESSGPQQLHVDGIPERIVKTISSISTVPNHKEKWRNYTGEGTDIKIFTKLTIFKFKGAFKGDRHILRGNGIKSYPLS